jgi:diacylglycerol kinase (ATP)
MRKPGHPFHRRLRFALQGLAWAWRESSFRIQLLGAAFALGSLVWLRPGTVWCALVTLTVAAVLTAELINTALESALDRLHPARHDAIRVAKDCAAAAVLVTSLAALVVFGLMLADRLR